MADLTIFYPGTAPTIPWLRQGVTREAIVSTKLLRQVAGLLRREGTADLVNVVVAWADLVALKLAPDGRHRALGALHCASESTIYVRGSVGDARATDAVG